MRRLGYNRYFGQGGDQGAAVTDAIGGQAPEGLLGIRLNFPGKRWATSGAYSRTPRGTSRARHDQHLRDERLRLLPRAGQAAVVVAGDAL